MFGVNLVAEGVENEQESKVLAKAGCQVMQGCFFPPPLLVEEVETVLNKA